jgi:hypothetical protein
VKPAPGPCLPPKAVNDASGGPPILLLDHVELQSDTRRRTLGGPGRFPYAVPIAPIFIRSIEVNPNDTHEPDPIPQRTWLIALAALLFSTASMFAQTPEFTERPAFDPTTLILTWQDDPTTTMTIQWIGDRNWRGLPEVWYAPRGGDDWKRTRALRSAFPLTPMFIYRAQLRGLSPDTDYVFRIALSSPEYRFRTMPAQMPEKLLFVTGGDAGSGEPNRKTNIQAAAREPRFALLGGDLAYDNGKNPTAWIEWLEDWKTYMISPEGRMIPMVAAIGNHEVDGHFGDDPNKAPFFYSTFRLFDPRGYTALDFGDYLSLVLLNSGHTTSIAGEQTQWLTETLEARQDTPHVFVAYHVPAFPSHRAWDDPHIQEVRQHWPPVFERFNPAAVFENHDHAYKRTVPIKNGQEDPAGVIYLGDGCWGREPRTVKNPEDHWYLAQTASKPHFILVELTAASRRYTAIDNTGQVIDEVVQNR